VKIPDQAHVIVGGGGAQRGGIPSRLLAKDPVELGIAAEASLEGGGERRGAPSSAVVLPGALGSPA